MNLILKIILAVGQVTLPLLSWEILGAVGYLTFVIRHLAFSPDRKNDRALE